MGRQLTVLDQVEVASPCHESWDLMVGNDRVRFCERCALNVYNLSAMPRAEAERLVHETEGRLCVRFFRRADGTMLTENCPVGWRAARLRVKVFAAGITAAFAGAAGFFRPQPSATMGNAKQLPPPAPEPKDKPVVLMGVPAIPRETVMGRHSGSTTVFLENEKSPPQKRQARRKK